jgi:tetratricopeptide (TPR) repeat protein
MVFGWFEVGLSQLMHMLIHPHAHDRHASVALALGCRQQGNEALKSGDSHAAEVLYTKAIGLDKRNHTVYSNRSKARLNLKNYHGAVGDAEKAISLSRDWGKGYFRAAEVGQLTRTRT